MADDRNPRGYRPDPYGRATPPAPTPAPAAQQPSDPLAELARLIGQSDPFNLDPRPPRDPRAAPPSWPDPRAGRDAGVAQPSQPATPPPPVHDWRRSEPPPRAPEPDYDDAPHDYVDPRYLDQPPSDARYRAPYGYGQAGDERGGYAPLPMHEPRFPQDRPFPEDGRGYDQTGLADYGRFGRESDYETDEEAARASHLDETSERAKPQRRGLATAIAIFCLVVVGTAGAFGYRLMFSGGSSGPAPVIRADSAPAKLVPPAQGSSDASANKQIYDRLADRSQDERMVPREEQPVEIRDATRSAVPRMLGAISPPATTAPALVSPPTTAGTAPAAANPTQEPRKVQTIKIGPDQGMDTSARAPAVGRPQTGPMPIAPEPARPAGAGPLSLTPEVSPAATTRPPRSAALAQPPAAVPSAPAGSGYVVQVLAQDTEAQAQASFRSIQARYPNQLGGLQPIIRRKEVGGSVKYGAQVGPYASRQEAVQLCEALKAAGGSCFVAKN